MVAIFVTLLILLLVAIDAFLYRRRRPGRSGQPD